MRVPDPPPPGTPAPALAPPAYTAPAAPPPPAPPPAVARPIDPPALTPNDLDVGTAVAAPAPIGEPPAGSSRGAHGQPLAQRRDDAQGGADGAPSLGLDFLDSPEVRAAIGDETSALWFTLTGRGNRSRPSWIKALFCGKLEDQMIAIFKDQYKGLGGTAKVQ